jgi:hypothetical protein
MPPRPLEPPSHALNPFPPHQPAGTEGVEHYLVEHYCWEGGGELNHTLHYAPFTLASFLLLMWLGVVAAVVALTVEATYMCAMRAM